VAEAEVSMRGRAAAAAEEEDVGVEVAVVAKEEIGVERHRRVVGLSHNRQSRLVF
jgi:hypothetical protein